MKTTILSGIAILCAAVAAAQTPPASTQSKPQATPATSAEKTITLTGCVGSLPGAAGGFVLSNPTTVASSAEAKGPAGEISSPPSSSQTATSAAPPAGAAATGTSGKSESKGYKLSGTDMSSWSGKHVQLVGSVVPAATGANAAADGNPGSTGETLPEFRVKTVQPTAGNCPEK